MRALYVSLNSPVVTVEGLPTGPASAAVALPSVVAAMLCTASRVKKPWWAVTSTFGKVSNRANTSSWMTWADRSSKKRSASSS